MLTRSTIAMLALLLIAGKGWAGELTVIESYAPRSLTPTAKSAVVYFTISNTGVADKIVGVSTPSAISAMIHESKIVDDIATMIMLDGIDVPAGSTIAMAQGGLHIMLMGLKAPLKEGEILKLDVTFEKAGMMKVEVLVTGLIKPAASNSP